MAITDISISEELETGAPSIKYRGNEGPKSPEQNQKMMVDALLEEEYEKYIYDLLEQRPDATPMSFEEFRRMVMSDQAKGPILPSPEDPVNPFGPKPEGPVLPNRKMAAYGGIMGRDGRKQYGIGSFIRKLIPNELAKVAEVAAPVVAAVAPQFALPAALAGGLGKFDRTGKFGDALKSGAMTYGIGALSPGVSKFGINEMGKGTSMFNTQPFGGDYNITNLSERFFPKKPTGPVNAEDIIGSRITSVLILNIPLGI